MKVPGTELVFYSGTITTEETVLESEHFICTIGPGIYVPDKLLPRLEELYDALEAVSGLSFRCEKYGKVTIRCIRNESNPGGETGLSFTSQEEVVLYPGDLFVIPRSVTAHELSHALNDHNCGWFFCRALSEGFADYNAYQAIQYLEKKDPELAFLLDSGEQILYNDTIHREGYDKLYTQSLAYGDGVMEGFYPWLKEHEDLFEQDYDGYYTDRTALKAVVLYPQYTFWTNGEVLRNLRYRDLYLGLDETRRYITEYKGDSLHNFRFTVDSPAPVTVELYGADGTLLSTVTAGGPEAGEHSLEGVSYLKLPGDGEITSLILLGFGEVE